MRSVSTTLPWLKKSSKTKHLALFIFKDTPGLRTCWVKVGVAPPQEALPPQTELLATPPSLHPSLETVAITRAPMPWAYFAVLPCDYIRKDSFSHFSPNFFRVLYFSTVLIWHISEALKMLRCLLVLSGFWLQRTGFEQNIQQVTISNYTILPSWKTKPTQLSMPVAASVIVEMNCHLSFTPSGPIGVPGVNLWLWDMDLSSVRSKWVWIATKSGPGAFLG